MRYPISRGIYWDFGDNFHRALDAMPEDTPAAVREGLEAMQKDLLQTFDRHGIRKIEPLDEPFDAISMKSCLKRPCPVKRLALLFR